MTAKILDSKALAQTQRQQLAQAIRERLNTHPTPPGLAVVLVGDNPASQIYVRKKQEACHAVGIHSQCDTFSADISQNDLLAHIHKLNNTHHIHGILVQLPLPAHINTAEVLNAVLPEKDVDGFHAINLGKLALNQPALRACTPKGIMDLLQLTDLTLAGANACVVGASIIVGKPMSMMLLNAEATVTTCHIRTRDLPFHIQHADLLVVAIGQPNFIQGSWIKPGAVVIDVGTNRLANGTITGDVDFATAKERAGWITPVPGGVGPMTVTALLQNTFEASCNNAS